MSIIPQLKNFLSKGKRKKIIIHGKTKDQE